MIRSIAGHSGDCASAGGAGISGQTGAGEHDSLGASATAGRVGAALAARHPRPVSTSAHETHEVRARGAARSVGDTGDKQRSDNHGLRKFQRRDEVLGGGSFERSSTSDP